MKFILSEHVFIYFQKKEQNAVARIFDEFRPERHTSNNSVIIMLYLLEYLLLMSTKK